MSRSKLTEAQIKAARPGTKPDGSPKRVLLRCDRNLFVQIDQGAEGVTRSFVLRYCYAGVTRQMGLGPFPDVGLSAARDAAAIQRGILASGRDPLTEKRAAKATVLAQIQAEKPEKAKKPRTFGRVAEEYVSGHKSSWSNAKSLAAWETTLKMYVSPKIGDKLVSDITDDDILEILRPIWVSKSVTAKAVMNRIAKVIGYAMARKYCPRGHNPAAWRDHLEYLLPKLDKQVSHHAALPFDRIAELMTKLSAIDDVVARCLRFTVLCAARAGEARGARWHEIDPVTREWCIPGRRMKNRKAHRVPLSDAAFAVLMEVKGDGVPEPDGYVFSRLHGFPFSEDGMRQMIKALCPGTPVTVHGCRSTFRDFCGDATDAPRELAEQALAHTVSGVEGCYRRGDAIAKRRALMEQWAAHCVGATVIEFRRSA
jgi:integrase